MQDRHGHESETAAPFLSVAERGSISAAAQSLCIAQPALTRQVREPAADLDTQPSKRATRDADRCRQAASARCRAPAQRLRASSPPRGSRCRWDCPSCRSFHRKSAGSVAPCPICRSVSAACCPKRSFCFCAQDGWMRACRPCVRRALGS
ncbi:LysR family transcriptional regulator [Paracoccus sp. P2]|uniref:LysR family transcriptional regulator n=1 Tax=Paracoccus pantotrophus TaxID=82367 RepID=A0A7H9BTK7_PARPN|nr:LysR family transcriptional regulator [Paracoccus pantotrophus]QLH14185.1 LysR family transcriptional regulator [Paracoccus pantotrophus]RDD96496.1 LysR family transcriptional regulator [Paracoccus pantotrophus]RNI16573.1 LysR family transcriptional regulator [Paracoccus pantotrophus]WGR67674.1 LysR family transcriptional regulator [Paracoccus pantotrophus]